MLEEITIGCDYYKTIFRLVNKYDRQGNLALTFFYGYINNYFKMYQYGFDNHKIEEITIDERGKIVEKTIYNERKLRIIYEYDNTYYNVIKQTNLSYKIDLWSYIYEYDSYGNWIKRIEYDNDEPIEIIFREIEYYD